MVKFLKRIFSLLMSRGFIISLLLLTQLLLLFYIAWEIGQYGIYIYIFFNIISVIVSFGILNRSFNPAYKMSWLLLVLTIPFAGLILYLMFGRLRLSKRRAKKINELYNDSASELKKNHKDVMIEDGGFKKITNYITNVTGMQVWDNTISKLLTPGEEFYKELLEELNKAEKFILLEYFIIDYGIMWDSVLKILEDKISKGVEVLVIYDDFGCINRVGHGFKKDLIKRGIKVVNFNPFRPRLTMVINYRDHRKITVIDGNVGFVGGINLADEYINKISLFGYWKDASIMLKGEAVWNLTFLFLQMWQTSTNDKFNYDLYRPSKSYSTNGHIQPFGDGPLDNHQTIEMVYIQIINNAKKYVYINTPYLVLDNEMSTALKTAAYSGIDVRILMPHKPDKKLVFLVSQAHYKDLINAGVKIYEYIPGFLHSKSIVSDDEIAMIGTANLDYRSFYLHYEVSCLLYQTTSVTDILKDYLECLEVSHQVTFEECMKRPFLKKILVAFLRAFSPMI